MASIKKCGNGYCISVSNGYDVKGKKSEKKSRTFLNH